MSNIIYHDTVWQKVDRPKMNGAVFGALKPGGRYVVCDSSAKDGTGIEAAERLHRIDEAVVRSEVSAAGFKLVEEGNFLRNPADPRDWSSSPMAAKERRGRAIGSASPSRSASLAPTASGAMNREPCAPFRSSVY